MERVSQELTRLGMAAVQWSLLLERQLEIRNDIYEEKKNALELFKILLTYTTPQRDLTTTAGSSLTTSIPSAVSHIISFFFTFLLPSGKFSQHLLTPSSLEDEAQSAHVSQQPVQTSVCLRCWHHTAQVIFRELKFTQTFPEAENKQIASLMPETLPSTTCLMAELTAKI